MEYHQDCYKKQITHKERYTFIEEVVRYINKSRFVEELVRYISDNINELTYQNGKQYVTREQAVVCITATIHELSKYDPEIREKICTYGTNHDKVWGNVFDIPD